MEQVISPKYTRLTGKDAWKGNMHQVIFAADKIRSTIGPKGAYKLVTYNRGPEQVVKVTKDAIAILEELALQYPPAVIVSESAKMQRTEAGDGVACFVVFLSALLKKADQLSALGLHANTILDGYRLATQKALQLLDAQSKTGTSKVDVFDTVDCGRNFLTPNIQYMIREAYRLGVSNGCFDIDNLGFIKKSGGSIQESALINGVVVRTDKAHPNMPNRVRNLRVAVTSGKLGINRLQLKMRREGPFPIKVNLNSPQQIRALDEVENNLENGFLKPILDQQINVLVCEQPIEEQQKTTLLSHGVFALESVTKKDSEAIVKATGAKMVATIRELSSGDVGTAKDLSVDKLEREKTVTFRGCGGATFLLRGCTPQIIDELEVAIRNSLTVLKVTDKDSRFLPGAGAAEAYLAQELKGYAKTVPHREQLAIQAFADALMDIPRCLAENNGLNPTDALVELRQRHANGLSDFGVDEQGCAEGVCFEPLCVKRSVIRRAYEVSSLMLRIDELLISKEIAKFHKK